MCFFFFFLLTKRAKERGNSCRKKWRILQMKDTHKHAEASLKRFGNHTCLSRSEESKCMWIHGKDGVTVSSPTLTLFWSRKTCVIVETFPWSFRVFMCAFHPVISSFLCYLYFSTSPFHVFLFLFIYCLAKFTGSDTNCFIQPAPLGVVTFIPLFI